MHYTRFISRFFIILFTISPAYALLDLELTQGIDRPLPIAILPWDGLSNDNSLDNITTIISHDLKTSGRFQVLTSTNSSVDTVLTGDVQNAGMDKRRVTFSLSEVYGNKQVLLQDSYTASSKQMRKVAHHIADRVYEKLTGIPGIFSTRIAYVLVNNQGGQKQYHLIVADADGENPHAILTSPEPIMSPAWSHDGRKLAYVSFENRRSQIFVSDIASGQRRVITRFPGINGAPAWSPEDTKLAVVLSKGGSPKIYQINLNSGQLTQLTSGNSIDTEPTWSPDGRMIVFTSDRGGAPQLYKLNLADRQVERITFSGNYNARASFTPDGKRIAMIHADQGDFTIAVQSLENGKLDRITKSGREDSPSVAPNGNMVLYGTEYGELGAVSLDGRVSIRIPASGGIIQGPSWGPKT